MLAARVGDAVVHARADDALAFEGWPRANAVLRGGRPQPLPGADLDGFVLVGCDPALGLAAALLPEQRTAPRDRALRVRPPRRWVPCVPAVRTRPSCTARLAAPEPAGGRAAVAPGALAGRHRQPRSAARVGSRAVRPRDPGGAEGAGRVQPEGIPGRRRRRGRPAAAGSAWPPGTLRWRGASRRARRPASRLSRLRSAGTWRSSRSRSTSSRSGSTRAGASTPPSPRSGDLLRSAAFTARLALIGGYELAGCGSQSGDVITRGAAC